MSSIYYGMISEVDDWVGKILKRLDELGLADHTLVIFTSDHGEMLGDHGLHSKMVFYEGSAHVPLLMRLPGVIPAGTVVRTPASQLDMFATILEYLNQPAHPSAGQSLRPCIEGTADGKFEAYDAASGQLLWSARVGGAIRAAPSTVMVDGEQYIIVPTGNGAASSTASYVSRYTSTPEARTPPRLLAFKLGGKAKYPAFAKFEPTPLPPQPRPNAELAHDGYKVFKANACSACHGAGGAAVGNRPPNLNKMPPADLATLRMVVKDGALAPNGMPGFKDLSDAELEALYAYIINEAWNAYDLDRGKPVTSTAH